MDDIIHELIIRIPVTIAVSKQLATHREREKNVDHHVIKTTL